VVIAVGLPMSHDALASRTVTLRASPLRGSLQTAPVRRSLSNRASRNKSGTTHQIRKGQAAVRRNRYRVLD